MSFNKYYYEVYLPLHRDKYNKRCHYVGIALTLFYICFCIINLYWWPLIMAPFISYPFAWIGHLFFEVNIPASWSNPFYAKLANWRMFIEWMIGKRE